MKLRQVIKEADDTPEKDDEFYAAVAIVGHGNKWLLGLSKADDDRSGRWVFPGGGIKSGESPEKAAARECKEETGVICNPVKKAIRRRDKKGVAFVRCRANTLKLKPNHEFAALGWFSRPEMRALRLYHNVYGLIDRVT